MTTTESLANTLMIDQKRCKGKSFKLTIVEILQSEGYDFITACEHADKYIKEIAAKGPGTYIYYSKTQEITIRAGKVGEQWL